MLHQQSSTDDDDDAVRLARIKCDCVYCTHISNIYEFFFLVCLHFIAKTQKSV